MSNKFFMGLVIAIVIIGGIFVATKKDSKVSNNSNAVGQKSNHVKGAGNKKVVIEEFGDFECPGCGAYYPLIKQVEAAYGEDITFQFHNFPLTQIHQSAMAAHRAAEAASLQGKFWEMHDLLYENQKSWKVSASPSQIFEQYATDLKLDIAKFKTDVGSDAVFGTINADIKEGQKYKFTGTPSFVINGKAVDAKDLGNLDLFKKYIDAEIAKNNSKQ